ncbi:Origin recognition complex (ORC) subunit 3 N-terminus domain containing protein [Rhypophila decipiens]
MAQVDDEVAFQEDDHRAAYIFTPPGAEDDEVSAAPSSSRPAKRRRVSSAVGTTASPSKRQREQTQKKKGSAASNSAAQHGTTIVQENDDAMGSFVPLFNGAESKEAVQLRKETFEAAWDGCLDERIQRVLREANQNTLDEVGSFIEHAGELENSSSMGGTRKIPAAFIMTGPNIASQDLLFEQLAESLSQSAQARVVRLRAAGAPNLKAVLKKIIRDAAAGGVKEEEEETEGDGAEVSVGGDGRKYLDYDLEGLHAFLKTRGSRRVIVAFEDSEAFDNGLLTDLIALFHSWQNRIHFSLLFGIATSVELFQARLLKATAQQLYGAQFDVVQANSVLESVFKSAVAGTQATVRLGPSLLRSLLERQRDQVAGIHVFISSLKYAYMCHFYANPLSICLAENKEKHIVEKSILQPQHLQALRTLPSFRSHVEISVEEDRQFAHAQLLIQEDSYLRKTTFSQRKERRRYVLKLLRCLHLLTSSGLLKGSFPDIYVNALENGIALSNNHFFSQVIDAIKRLSAEKVLSLARSLTRAIKTGSAELDLPSWESQDEGLLSQFTYTIEQVSTLLRQAAKSGNPLKSKYTAQSKVLRTTVVAQKVQLSRDSATLTEQDMKFTAVVDSLIDTLSAFIWLQPIKVIFLNEVWVYNSRKPYREVFIPRPGMVIDRALGRPHDYLGCECCALVRAQKRGDAVVMGSMPATAILYHLYLEAGSLVNVADLWAAYFTLVGDEEDGEGEGLDERTALVHFYRGLAELKVLGFVKASKRKADHVAKLKWVGGKLGRIKLGCEQQHQPPFHPLFPKKIQTLSLPLAPFVQLTSGLVHPAFPQTLLHFWLLTSDQLDALAAFYHQSPPCKWTAHYPCPIVYHADLSLEEKRRKIGKFIGLRGCETPVQTSQNVDENNNGFWGRAKTEDEIMEDARRARMNQEEDEIRRKMGWY